MAEWRDIFEAPKWAGFSSFLKDECFERGLRADIEVERGWIREKVAETKYEKTLRFITFVVAMISAVVSLFFAVYSMWPQATYFLLMSFVLSQTDCRDRSSPSDRE